MDAGGVSVGGVVDNANLGAQCIFGDVVCRGNALVGVGEADLEYILAGLDDGLGGGGGGHHKQIVIGGLGGNGQGRGSGGGTCQNLHAPVLQAVVGIDALLGIVLVILKLEVKHGVTGSLVDLLDSQLLGVLDRLTVDGSAAGDRTDAADLDGGEVCGCGGAAGGGSSVRGRSGRSGRGAAGGKAQSHRSRQNRTNELFHISFPPKDCNT